MVKIKCEKCGFRGYSATLLVKCECGSVCKESSTLKIKSLHSKKELIKKGD